MTLTKHIHKGETIDDVPLAFMNPNKQRLEPHVSEA